MLTRLGYLIYAARHGVYPYFSGRRHAGENLDDILTFRDPDLPPIQWMSDSLAANNPKQHQKQTLDINCIAHGRRKFIELEAFFPNECTQVIDAIAEVYKHEAHCKEQKLTPQQRLAYHQKHRRAGMDGFKAWMEKTVGSPQMTNA